MSLSDSARDYEPDIRECYKCGCERYIDPFTALTLGDGPFYCENCGGNTTPKRVDGYGLIKR